MKLMKKKPILLITALFIFTTLGCGIYVSDYYRADRDAIVSFQEKNTITKKVLSDNTIAYLPENAEQALIFYPGGKVEYAAYEPLMAALSEHSIATFLVEMPFNLAVLDMNAADRIIRQYPEFSSWMISGHSLGGTMAASYLENHLDEIEGLILLGSYSIVDFSQTDLKVLSIYGSEDQVLNHDKYEENKVNLPDTMTEVILEGGNHAQFGMYGPQSGDGQASISNEVQIQRTVEEIIQFIQKP